MDRAPLGSWVENISFRLDQQPAISNYGFNLNLSLNQNRAGTLRARISVLRVADPDLEGICGFLSEASVPD